jgi:NAD(P)H-dependent FMN reductase
MYYIPVILGSIRRSRESVKVASFVVNSLAERPDVNTELLDLKRFDLPMMEERLRFRDDASPAVREFSGHMGRADAIVIVTPEYNSGYPGVLKNALDYLKDEYRRKPFGIITVSAAWSGGMLCLTALRQVILHLGGVPIPAILPVSKVQKTFDKQGDPVDQAFRQRVKAYFDELLWFTEALVAQKKRSECSDPKLKSSDAGSDV